MVRVGPAVHEETVVNCDLPIARSGRVDLSNQCCRLVSTQLLNDVPGRITDQTLADELEFFRPRDLAADSIRRNREDVVFKRSYRHRPRTVSPDEIRRMRHNIRTRQRQ